ncbi:MAG TPA: hypothetical protein VEA99_01945 [Gemmatimonadaceae bacterium]|nr:hypothetical protein [Gemmatimonadaceae bacterium]
MKARALLLHPNAAALLSAAATLLSSWLLKHTALPAAARVVVALLVVPPLLLFLVLQLRWLRGRDELQQRIQLEALAVGFCGSLVLGLAAIQLRHAGALPPLNPGVAWSAMVALYIVGFYLACRRYR